MPFKSAAQRRWMYANDPAMAKRWAKHRKKRKKSGSIFVRGHKGHNFMTNSYSSIKDHRLCRRGAAKIADILKNMP